MPEFSAIFNDRLSRSVCFRSEVGDVALLEGASPWQRGLEQRSFLAYIWFPQDPHTQSPGLKHSDRLRRQFGHHPSIQATSLLELGRKTFDPANPRTSRLPCNNGWKPATPTLLGQAGTGKGYRATLYTLKRACVNNQTRNVPPPNSKKRWCLARARVSRRFTVCAGQWAGRGRGYDGSTSH